VTGAMSAHVLPDVNGFMCKMIDETDVMPWVVLVVLNSR
jgi:hypothetical protein